MDYKEIGFKCGLEIHQQIDEKKLFCSCNSIIRKDNPSFTVTRKLRASAGETGDIDIAAKHEATKGKYFIYQGYDDICLVEMDEEPPHMINERALNITIQVAKILNAKIVDEIQVMRKVVIDGSNTSGFQRTALVASDGALEINGKKITIPTICLEEEACQVIERKKEYDIYNLSRLGIPLIEIGTDPSICSPEECKEVAAKLGMVLRSVKGIKRGIGSIRQDVNVSIKKGARVEIKGFQEYKSIPKIVEYETERHLKLLGQGKKIEKEVRKAEPNLTTSFLRPISSAARMYPETDIPPIVISEETKGIKTPELLTKKIKELEKKYDLKQDLAKELVDNKFFLSLVKKFRIEPQIIAHTLVNVPKEIKKRFKLDSGKIKETDFEEVLSYLAEKKIAKEAIIDILVKKIRGETISLKNFKTVDEKELENEIKALIKQKPGLSDKAYMGIIMAKYRGKIDGKKVMEILKKFVKDR